MIQYELWMHRRTGESYAVRLQDGRVTGAAGPLGAAALARRTEITAAEYVDGLAAAPMEMQRARFAVVDMWGDSPGAGLDRELVAGIR